MRLAPEFIKKKYGIMFEDNDVFRIKAKDLREFATDMADSFGDAQSAQFVAQKNGKTSFWLGANLREIKKIGLRRFSNGTLPAILPAPVLAADRPGIAAPGQPFRLSGFISGPATGPAAIAEYTRQVSDGDHVVLTGTALALATYPVYQNGNFYATSVTEQDFEKAAVRLPRVGAAWDAALAWPSTGAGIGLPVLLNTARVKWEQDVWAPGLTVQLFGENLAHGNMELGAGYVAIRQGNGPIRVYDTTAANPYRAPFQVPTTVVPGPLEYWYHNGHGGEYGWAARRTVTVVTAAEHVLLRDFTQQTQALALSATDGALNAALIRQAYLDLRQRGGTFTTPAGPAPLSGPIQPSGNVRWVCETAASGGVTTLVATSNWVIPANDPDNLGMFGSNYWVGGEVEGVEFSKPDNVQLGRSEAVVVLNNLDQVCLRRVRARWHAPYDTRQAGPVKEAVPAQPMRLSTSKNVFLDELTMTGSGVHLGSNSQVFFTGYTHRATHNADYMLYGLNMLGWAMIGYDLRDLDPASTDGVNRGIRCIKSGGQGGRNRYRHLEKGIGTDLGIMRSGTNQAPDDNQFEQDLDEYNITVYTDKVVSATANTVTVPRTLIVQVNNQPVRLVKPDEHLVAIVAGRGVGQWRGVVSITVNTITVDEPWLVEPDATSVLHTGWFSCDSTRYDVHYTAKPDNARNPLYNHGAFYNGFGGVRGGIIDKCSGDGFRQGISLVATQHDSDKVDQTAFNVVRNCAFPNSRWGRRFEAVPGQAGWVFDVPGLYCTLFSNCTYENSILAPLVYQLPRDTAGPVPSIAMLVEENQPVDVGLNDYTPSFVDDPKFPPVPPVAGTVATSGQLVRQAQVAPTAPGVQLVAGGELGPLEPLPVGAQLDTISGMLSYPDPNLDEAILVFVDGVQVAPLARTLAVGTGTSAPAPIWAYVGDPALQSISLGPLDLASNAFDPNGLDEGNVFFAAQFVVNNTVGADFSGNLVYGQFSDNTIGANCHSNTFRGAFTFNKVGINVNACYFDLDTSYTEIGDGCERVTLFNCRGTPQQPFEVPAGTKDAEYRNNKLVTSNTGPTTTGLPITATRTAAYTLALTDADHLVPVSSASAVTVTVPAHADVPFPTGTTLYIAQDGTGDVTIAGASGVVIQKADGYKVGGRWLDVALHKRNLNTWVLKGGVS